MVNKSWHILIIDDNPHDRAEVRAMLLRGSGRSCRFTEADTGEAGLRACAETGVHPPDCVILDYNLPDMTASDVLKRLCADSDLPPFPVAVVTGGNDILGQKLIREGAQDYVGKSWISDASLTRTVENAIDRFALMGEYRLTQEKLRASDERLRLHAATLETLVAQRTASLEETVRDLEVLCYSIAHHLRAPLRSVHGFAEILRDKENHVWDSASEECLTRIIRSAARMDRLILDLLTFARVSRSEMPLEPVNPASLIRKVIQSHPVIAKSAPDIDVIEPMPMALGNEEALTQCLTNLLLNGVSFVAPGVKPALRIWAESHGAFVRLCVKDNGIGIAPENHEIIFHVFQQLNPDGGGTGIGLAIAKKCAERMGGKLGMISELGKGSRFWIDLQNLDGTSGRE